MPSSLTMLLPSALGFSPHPPVSVYGTGTVQTIAAFLGSQLTRFTTFSSLRITSSHCPAVFPTRLVPRLHRSLHSRLALSFCVPTVLLYSSTGISACCPSTTPWPRLRSRLTQGRSALPWKPWIFGRKDSHLPLATHSGILSSIQSTAPSGTASPCMQCSSTNVYDIPELRWCVSAPDIFGAGPLD